MDFSSVEGFAHSLGVSPEAVKALGGTRNRDRASWDFPERDGSGKPITTMHRHDTGDKRADKGKPRGL